MRFGKERHEAESDVGRHLCIHQQEANHLKALTWDRNGFAIFYKRLETGTFALPEEDVPTWAQMVMMLEGVSLKTVKYRPRYAVKSR